eukprot:525936-Amphidinium_carterae.1
METVLRVLTKDPWQSTHEQPTQRNHNFGVFNKRGLPQKWCKADQESKSTESGQQATFSKDAQKATPKSAPSAGRRLFWGGCAE